jgi:hypothetical protein
MTVGCGKNMEGALLHKRQDSAAVSFKLPLSVMAGLVPAIHAIPVPANPELFRGLDDVAG